ncbi:MAG: aldolase/citrate lyase family protein [Rhodanobacter sp.]
MRSKLSVPGARPELFAKAWAGDADALAFDLEDSVPADRKAEARTQVVSFLRDQVAPVARKVIIVRTNALDTPHFEADVLAVAGVGIDLVNLPKVESVDEVTAAVEMLERAEVIHRLNRPIRLLINIETPRELHSAAKLAAAHPRVAGLQLGLADLFEPLGIDRRDVPNVHATMFVVRMAAAAAGIFACDGAFGDVRDEPGFRVEASMARRLG